MFLDRRAAFSIAIIVFCGIFGTQVQTINAKCNDSTSTGDDQERTWTVENTSQALDLAEAVKCSGRAFDVEWKGNVIVEKTIYISNGTFLNVTGVGSGAVINGTGAIQLFMVANASLYLHNVSISNGWAKNGGAVWASDANLTFNGAAFVGNNASLSGGALFLTRGSVGLFDKDTLFLNNYASFGGALFTDDNCSLSWNGSSSFTGNTAATYGGALHAAGGPIISFEGSKVFFLENSAAKAGGALYVAGNATVNMNSGAAFINNSIFGNKGVGGAISVSDARSNVSWSLEASFTGNTAYSGGALYLTNGACVYYDGPTDFASNTAMGSGGGIGSEAFGSQKNAVESSLFIRAATSFMNNTAYINGGGMALLGMLIVTVETTEKVTFSGNTADVAGGAIFLSGMGVPPTFSNILFDSNLAEIGGAVYAVASGTELTEGAPNPTTFIGCIFRNNSAKASGGAVATAAGRDTFNDSVFIDNSAAVGGALWLAGIVTIANCSFVDNVADEGGGPAVSNVGVINTVTGSIFDGNMFSCQDETFLDFQDLGNLYETVCLGCPDSSSNCDFAKSRMVPNCSPTVKHSSSPGGTVTVEELRIDADYWRATNKSLNIRKCLNMDACLGGLTGSKGFCKKGYEGPYCSICSKGYTSCLDFACSECTDRASGITLVAVLGVLTIFSMVALASHLCSGEQNVAYNGIVGRILGLIPLQSLKIVIISWQILTQIASVANITYPRAYERFLNVVSVLNFDLSWVMAMGCIVNVDFHHHLLIVTISPFVALIFLGVTYTVAQNKHRWSAAAIRTIRYKHASAALLLTFLVYSSVSSVLFQMFSCERLDDGHVYLRADYRIKCDSPKHIILQIYAAAMIIIYPIGIVALYATLLLRNRKALQKKNGRENNLSIRSISELWKPYRPSRYYYELMECVRRALLSGVSVLIYPDPSAQVRLMMVIVFGFFGIAEGLAPYESTWNAWISRSGHVIIFMSLYVALLLEGSAREANDNNYLAFEVILVFAHGCLVLALVVESVMLTCSLRSVPLEKPLPRFRSAKSFASGQAWNTKDSEHPFHSNTRTKVTATVGFPCTENTIRAAEDLFISSASSSDEDTKEIGMRRNDDVIEG